MMLGMKFGPTYSIHVVTLGCVGSWKGSCPISLFALKKQAQAKAEQCNNNNNAKKK